MNSLAVQNDIVKEVPVKKWYTSKTLWANFLGLVVMLLSAAVTEGWLAPAIEGFVMIPINWILRMLTDQPITFSATATGQGSGDAGQK